LRLKRNPFQDIGFRYEILGGPVAAGGFAEVFRVRDLSSNEVRAAKRVPKDRISDNIGLRRELEILLTLDHPNVVRLFEWFESVDSIWLIQELCEGGEVLSLVGHCESREALRVIRQVLLGLAYIHDRGVIHRDVKLENCLFQSLDRSVLKIIDFGLSGVSEISSTEPSRSGQTTPTVTGKAGTGLYLAPELYVRDPSRRIKYTPKCDVWAVGIMAYILLTGEHPFWDKTKPYLEDDVVSRLNETEADVSGILPEAAADLLRHLLDKDPESRFTSHEALMHPCMRVSAFLGSPMHAQLMSNLRTFKDFRPLERVILTLIAYHCHDETTAAMREVFSLLDTDLNGVLSKQEIIVGMQRLGLVVPPDFDAILDSIDADHSGAIDFTEFVAAGLGADQVRSAANTAFSWLSNSQSSVITAADLEKVVDQEETVRVLTSYGYCGEISRDEFTSLIADIAARKEVEEPIALVRTVSKRRYSWDQNADTSPKLSPLRRHSESRNP
jgi:calcium-dependent protein kinase